MLESTQRIVHLRSPMHSGWLVETASLWGYHGSTLVCQRESLRCEAVNEYWIRNRVRLDGWNSLLTRYRVQTLSLSMARRIRAWEKLRSLIEEILLSEPLARVCVAVAAQLEERQVDGDSRAILHNVFTAHCEVRNRCLKIILAGVDRGIAEAAELNRLRHYLEHWTDLLLGYFANSSFSAVYAFSSSRMEEFSDDFSQPRLGAQSQMVWSLQLASCRNWLNKHCSHSPISPRMNQRICEAAMGMIHSQAFDSVGCMRSRLIQTIEYGIQHAEETLASLESNSWESMSKVLSVGSIPKPMRL
ncbi:MAG: hypothetical protein ACOVLE_01120 [Pirellula staleyi]